MQAVDPSKTSPTDAVALTRTHDRFVCRDALAKMHEDLVLQAKSAITSTEDSVRWLNEERQQTEHAVRALTDAGVGHDMRPKRKLCACCPPRTFCVIQ